MATLGSWLFPSVTLPQQWAAVLLVETIDANGDPLGSQWQVPVTVHAADEAEARAKIEAGWSGEPDQTRVTIKDIGPI